MGLQSQLFRGDPQLEAAAISDPAHIVPGAKGAHVGKIQQGLIQLDGATVKQDSIYGPATAAAVAAYKRKRQILNTQGKIDDIVGKKTIAALDLEMLQKEKGRRGGGIAVNFKISDTFPEQITHTLIYFSGVADDLGVGGLPISRQDQQEVFNDMLDLNVLPSLKTVNGFGGSLANKSLGVAAAVAIIATRDPRGQLIIYGYSAGGINSLDLCRALKVIGTTVDLLVTVDVSGRGEVVDRVVPTNVALNRNYFQTQRFNLSRAVGGPATGGRVITNINCDDRRFEALTKKTRHGQMQDITRFDAIRDMRVQIARFNLKQ